jgi:hypothetical protein
MGSEQNAVIEMELKALGRRNRTSFSKHKGVPRNKIVERPDSELSQLQNQIIMFLGQLDSITCLELLKVPQKQEDSIPWAICLKQPLLFPLPFKDMKLNINLGLCVCLATVEPSFIVSHFKVFPHFICSSSDLNNLIVNCLHVMVSAA